jgi:hypothetical protein
MNSLNELPLKIELKRVKKILEIDPKLYRICDIKESERGIVRKRSFHIHFDGKGYTVLEISGDGFNVYRLEPS